MRTRRHASSGQDLVEFALIVPLLLLLLLGIAEFSLIIFSYDSIANAAREGARYGAIHPDKEAEICDRALHWTTGLNGVLRCTPSKPYARTIRVTIDYEYEWITGLIMQAASGSETLTLRSVATMRTE